MRSEKIEFLSRQHIDFKTLGGMKQLLQAVTWRAKVEESLGKIIIYVRKKKIPDVRRIAKEFGVTNVQYEVKKIRWFECWLKRFKIVRKPTILRASSAVLKIKGKPIFRYVDPASKDGDFSIETTMEKKADGTFEIIGHKVINQGDKLQKPIPKFISKGQGKTPVGETLYFVEDPDGLLEVDKTIILNGKALKVKKIVRKKGNPLTGIVTKFI